MPEPPPPPGQLSPPEALSRGEAFSQRGPQLPDVEVPSAAFLLSGLGRIVREEIEDELRGVDMSLRHLSALGHLSRAPGMSYSELGRRAGVTAQSMQATLRQLEALGAVERVTLAGRGRTAELHLTAVGRDLLARGRDAVRRVDESLLGGLATDEKAQLTELLLRTFTEVAERRTGR